MRAFVAAYGATLGKLAADQQFARLARDVAAAASSEARFPTGRAQFAADLWNRYTSKPYPRMEAPLRRFAIATGRRKLRGWAHAPETLLSRILLEADQLVFERPRLQLCGLCGRPFVPFAREAHCHGHLWSRNSRRLRALCERHVPFTVTARRERTEHERKRDRSYQQILRWNRHLESSDDPDERKRLEKLIADLTAERAGELKRRGPSTTRPVVTEEAGRTKGDTDGIASGSA